MKIKWIFPAGLLVCSFLVAAGFAAKQAATATKPTSTATSTSTSIHADMDSLMMMGNVTRAVAVMVPTKGHKAHGVVYFQQQGRDVHITGHIDGLAPGSTHAIQAYEYGDLTSSNGSSTGDHYNPEGNPHGLPPHTPRQAGDFGNITASDKGVAKIDITVSNITVAGMRNPVLGRAVIVHADKDNGSQPAGGVGEPIAMGVIGVAQPEQKKKKQTDKSASTQVATQPRTQSATQPATQATK